jgi:hypothetical protein
LMLGVCWMIRNDSTGRPPVAPGRPVRLERERPLAPLVPRAEPGMRAWLERELAAEALVGRRHRTLRRPLCRSVNYGG